MDYNKINSNEVVEEDGGVVIDKVAADKTDAYKTTTADKTKNLEKKIKELLKLARELGLNITETDEKTNETNETNERHESVETSKDECENSERPDDLLVIVAEPLKTKNDTSENGSNIKQQIMRIENTLFDFCRAYSSVSNAIDSLKDCVMALPKKIDEQFSKVDELIESEKRLMKFLEAKVVAGRPDYFSGANGVGFQNPQQTQPVNINNQENMRSIIASKMMKI